MITELQGLPWYAKTKPGVKQAAKAYLVHEGLCERGLINLIVAMLAVAHDIHHHIALPLLAPLSCQLTSTHLQSIIIVTKITMNNTNTNTNNNTDTNSNYNDNNNSDNNSDDDDDNINAFQLMIS